MLTRREFWGRALAGVAASAAVAARDLRGAGRLAWSDLSGSSFTQCAICSKKIRRAP